MAAHFSKRGGGLSFCDIGVGEYWGLVDHVQLSVCYFSVHMIFVRVYGLRFLSGATCYYSFYPGGMVQSIG